MSACAGTPARLRWLPWLALVVLLLATAVVTRSVVRAEKMRNEVVLAEHADRFVAGVDSRLHCVGRAMQRAANLIEPARLDDGSAWWKHVERATLAHGCPGLTGLAFSPTVPAVRLADHVKVVRAAGNARYRVTPEGARAYYVPVVWVVSSAGAAASLIGVDLAADPLRRAALERSMASGTSTATAPLSLLHPDGAEPRRGIEMLQPIRRMPQRAGGVEGGKGEVLGFVEAELDVAELLRSVLADQTSVGSVVAFDGDRPKADAMLFGEDAVIVENKPILHTDRTLSVAGHVWTLRLAFADRGYGALPLSVAFAGGIAALLVFVWTRSAVAQRRSTRSHPPGQ